MPTPAARSDFANAELGFIAFVIGYAGKDNTGAFPGGITSRS